MIDITGYSDRLYARAGETIGFKVSCQNQATYQADIVRLICGDTNPQGPGYKEELIYTAVSGTYPSRAQKILAGSYIKVPAAAALAGITSFTFQAFIWPTMPGGKIQTIAAHPGFALMIDEDGRLAAEIGGARYNVANAMLSRRWYRAGVSFDAASGALRIFQLPLAPVVGIEDAGLFETRISVTPATIEGTFIIAARLDENEVPGDFYNGKIDSPTLYGRALSEAECSAAIVQPHQPGLIGAWDFSIGMDNFTAVDTSPHRLAGMIVNAPARAMKGWNWTGEFMDWKAAPSQWGAIHFHEDDLYDAGWQTDFTLTIPENMKSGLYAARVRSDNWEDHIPFTVTPAPGEERKIAFLLPTASYLAYSNDHLGTDGGNAEFLNNIVTILEPQDLFMNEHWEYGGSLYDAHSDGSGVCYSSRLRPTINMRPKCQNVLGGFSGSRLWQFNADTHITDWLEALGHPYDVITDEELDERGHALIGAYYVIITGSHPEYVSTHMWDALETFKTNGGRLMYLGGDGFYWRVAYNRSHPGIVELRRAESGIRAWIAEPGEYYHGFDGKYGGLWARQGRSPQSFVGVGFAAQGFDISSYYLRAPDGFKPAVSFVFEGIAADEKIGDFGLIGGGAAGLELDRAAPEYGTPPNVYVLASSVGHTDTYLLVPEELTETTPAIGGHESPLVRADMVFFETANNGAVFSTGSIAWAGSLSHNNYNNNVSRITDNVLRRFLRPDGFRSP